MKETGSFNSNRSFAPEHFKTLRGIVLVAAEINQN